MKTVVAFRRLWRRLQIFRFTYLHIFLNFSPSVVLLSTANRSIGSEVLLAKLQQLICIYDDTVLICVETVKI